PKARAEYAVFMRQPGADAAAARTLAADPDQEGLMAIDTREPMATPPPRGTRTPPCTGRVARDQQAHPTSLPVSTPSTPGPDAPADGAAPLPADPLLVQAEALVWQFYQRFHGLAQVAPTTKELTQATALLMTHGLEKAQYLLTFSHQAARATR